MRFFLPLIVALFALSPLASGHVRGRRLVKIGNEIFLQKLVYLGDFANAIDGTSCFTRDCLRDIGEEGLSLKEVNARTDQAVFDYLTRVKARQFADMKALQIFDYEKDPESFQSMVRAFFASTHFIVLEKAVGTKAADFVSMDSSLEPNEQHLRDYLHESLQRIASADADAGGEIVAILAIETLSEKHPSFFIGDRFSLNLSIPTPQRVDSLVAAPNLWIPTTIEPNEWLRGKKLDWTGDIPDSAWESQWIGDAVFLHSLFIHKELQRRPILAPLLNLALANGQLTNSRLIPAGHSILVNGQTIRGPALVRPTHFYSFCVGKARLEMHEAFGFERIFSDDADHHVVLATADTLNLDVRWAGGAVIDGMSQEPMFYDRVIRGESTQRPNVMLEPARRRDIGRIPVIDCPREIMNLRPIRRLYQPLN